MYKIRFHLGKGANFMKWQIKTKTSTRYVSPDDVQLFMFNAKLRVQLGTSNKIHEGACKTVCAWIECEDLVYGDPWEQKGNFGDYRVKFNPRNNPNWIDENENIVNEETFPLILTDDRTLIVVGSADGCECNLD
jgi:hypothetical protein